jgi:transposase
MRARIVLMASKGRGTTDIARSLGVAPRTVRKWKARFAEDPHIQTLEDRERSGRPRRISLPVRCRLVQLACERPDGEENPKRFREIWTHASLADALEAATGERISVSEVGRILRFEGLRPHRVRQWLKSTDPDFDLKAKQVCNLYLAPPKGAVVISVDEKPLQVLARKHATHVDHRDGSVRYEYEYKRHGTQALLAAFDIADGSVVARVVPSRNAEALVAFMESVAAKYPDQQVYVVWDNLNIHYDGKHARWTKFNERNGGRFHFVYTPKHASWMNQVEIWFSILQRRVIRHGDFGSPAAQKKRVLGFVRRWNRHERHPFRWTWRSDASHNRRRAA